MMTLFRRIALVEGVTTLLLFLVAMPLKYGLGWDGLIRHFGMAHGVAFIAYVIAMAAAFAPVRVRPLGWLRGLAAALFPFGTFLNDRWVARQVTA